MLSGILLAASLWASFADPSPESRPWCYWWWINGHVDRETITADLESMKELGFGGVLMFDSRGYWDNDDEHVVNPKAELGWGTPEWYDRVEFSVRECARLGLRFTMNASASGGTLNGFADGREYETDILDRTAVRAHLDRVVGPLLKRVPDLVGSTFSHVYSVSYEGNVKTGGSWKAIKDTFYASMSEWAHAHGLQVYSESGGPWDWGAKNTRLDCDQLDMLAHNDFPQGEFWPLEENARGCSAGHANRNGRFFSRATVLAARRRGLPIASIEAFTHMHRHWSADPAYLKPLADQAFADGINRLVWHTFTCSPAKFGIPGAEYFAGTHVNRNVTWQKEAAPFVRYLGRCQSLLQRGEPVDDGEFANVTTNYHGWGRFRKDPDARFTATHRREGTVDFFFVAGEGTGEMLFDTPVRSRSVEIWDPLTVSRRRAWFEPCGEKTRVRLDLPKGGSCFVVFGEGDGPVSAEPVARTMALTGLVWKVSFSFHPGVTAKPPVSVEWRELHDFTTLGSPDCADSRSVRYFSGTATYRTTFDLPENAVAFVRELQIGELKTGLAHVFVNGSDCGVAWCAPWCVPVGGALRPGANELVICYVNNWYNRLVGDCRLPADERVTRTTLHYWQVPRTGDPNDSWSLRPTVYSGYSSFDPLQPSGLAGPVALRMMAGERKRVSVLDMGLPAGVAGAYGCPSDPKALADALKGSFDIRIVRGEELAKELTRAACDLLVIPSGSAFPAEAADPLRRFLAQRGSFLSCGGYAFDDAVVLTNGAWRTVGGCKTAVPAARTPVALPKAAVWRPAGDGARVSDGLFDDASPCISFSTGELRGFASATAAIEVPPSARPSVVTVRGRDDGGTPRLWLELWERDGSRWHVLLPLARRETDYTFVPGDFTSLPENGRIGRGKKGDRVDFARVVRIGVAVNTEIFYAGRPFFASVGAVRFGQDPDAAARLVARPRINTRTAYIRDAIRPTPEQIGVFDLSFPICATARTATSAAQKELLPEISFDGEMRGLSALGPLGVNGNGFDANRCSWRPILDCVSKDGTPSGQAGAILRHHAGTYAGSTWAIFGVDNRDLFAAGSEGLTHLFPAVVERVLSGVGLNGTTADVSSWRRSERRKVMTCVRNDSGRILSGHVSFTLRDRSGKTVFARSAPVVASDGTNASVAVSWTVPESAPSYLALTAELFDDGGRLLDRERGAVTVWTPEAVAGGPRLRREGTRLTIDGEARFFLGANSFWGQHKSVTARSPLQFERDFAEMRRRGLRWTRLFLRLEDETTARDADAYVQLAAEHGIVLYLTPNLWNTAKPEELARETAKLREIAERYSIAPHLAIDLCNEPVMDGWTDHRAGAKAEYDWAKACIEAVHRVRPDLPVAVGWNGGWGGAKATKDPAFASLPLDFTDRHYYGIPERLMLEVKDIDQRALGKPLVVGECGAKCHPTFVTEDPWRMGDTEESYERRFRSLVAQAFGCGATALLTWHWRDPMEGIFPCGLVHATGVARPVLDTYERMARAFGRLPLADARPETVVILDEEGRWDPKRRGRVTNAVRALTETLVWLGADFSVVSSSQVARLPEGVRCVLDPAVLPVFDEKSLRAEVRGRLERAGVFVARGADDPEGLFTFRVSGVGATGWVFLNGTAERRTVARGTARLDVGPDRVGYIQLSDTGKTEVCEEL